MTLETRRHLMESLWKLLNYKDYSLFAELLVSEACIKYNKTLLKMFKWARLETKENCPTYYDYNTEEIVFTFLYEYDSIVIGDGYITVQMKVT